MGEEETNELINLMTDSLMEFCQSMSDQEEQCFVMSLIQTAVFSILSHSNSRKEAYDIINAIIQTVVERYDQIVQDKI